MTSLFVGTYASAGGNGLCELVETAAGDWRAGAIHPDAPNASHGASSARFGLHYLANEQHRGMLGIHRHDGSGWECLGEVATEGAEPCFVALDPDETHVAVANYGSGNIALFRLDPASGLPVEPAVVRQNQGSGPDRERQDAPHAHCVAFSPDRRWLYHVDLGADGVVAYPFGRAGGALGEGRVAFRAPPGTGPRHLVFHPRLPLALLIGELSSTLACLAVGDGVLTEMCTVSTLPEGFTGDSLGGHLALNAAGDRGYVTNRGHDSVATFDLDDAGTLKPRQHASSGGASPRFFLLLEDRRLLVVAHEKDGAVTMFGIAGDGSLSPIDPGPRVPGAAFVMRVGATSRDDSRWAPS